jgi:hypothetical protein
MNWGRIARFNFTWALPGGAWLEWEGGYCNWFSFGTIEAHKGQGWIERQLRAQAELTGHWIKVV